MRCFEVCIFNVLNVFIAVSNQNLIILMLNVWAVRRSYQRNSYKHMAHSNKFSVFNRVLLK